MYNPVPKPPKGKKKGQRLKNPVPTIDDKCTYPNCNRGFAHLHEVYYGRGKRQKSIYYGMQIRLCEEHHNRPGGDNPHHNKKIDTELKQNFQRVFEQQYSHELFMQEFGKNYLG